MPTATGIKTRFPGVFDSVSDATLNAAIAAASLQVNSAVLGPLTEEATTLLACHIAELGKSSRATGVQKAKAGLVEVDYGSDPARLGSTSFYELYKQMIKRVVFPIGPVG